VGCSADKHAELTDLKMMYGFMEEFEKYQVL
jgi:hypothetical protein